MKKLLLSAVLVFAFGCGKLNSALDNVNSVPGKFDSLNGSLKDIDTKSNEQAELTALNTLMDPILLAKTSTDQVPVVMMVPAQAYAGLLTADQAAQWFEAMLTDVNENQYTGDTSASGTAAMAADDAHRYSVMMAVELVAGFLPQATVDQMISDQIAKSGDERDTTLGVLYLRSMFFNSIRLNGQLFTKGVKTLGLVQDGVSYVNTLEAITKLPFATGIGLKIYGFQNPTMNALFTGILDPSITAKAWSALQQHAQPKNPNNNSGGDYEGAQVMSLGYSQDQTEAQREAIAYNQMMTTIAAKVAAYTPAASGTASVAQH